MKTMSPLLLTLMLAGCANAYKEAYVPAQGTTPEAIAAYRKGAAPPEPAVARGGPADLDALVQELAKRGYRGIGQASFTSSRQVPEFEAIEQGKRVGADLVLLLNPSFAGYSVSAVLKPAMGSPNAIMSALASAACGAGSCYGNGTRSTFGETSLYVPVPVVHSNYNAIYFALAR
jgi:serine protease Do